MPSCCFCSFVHLLAVALLLCNDISSNRIKNLFNTHPGTEHNAISRNLANRIQLILNALAISIKSFATNVTISMRSVDCTSLETLNSESAILLLTIRSAVDQVFADMLQSFFPLLRLIVKDYLNESFH